MFAIDYWSTMDNHRRIAADFLKESVRMIQHTLAEADFGDSFPNIFGEPDGDSVIATRNRCGLFLRKAELHLSAALRAHEDNNIHSLGVHARVIQECAANVQMAGSVVRAGTPKRLDWLINALEHDYRRTLLSLEHRNYSADEIRDKITDLRKRTGRRDDRPPTGVRITDKVAVMDGGRDWYEHLSESFGHTSENALTGLSFNGGVASRDPEVDDISFAALLDTLTCQIVSMLLDQELLVIAVGGDSDRALLDWVHDLIDRLCSAMDPFWDQAKEMLRARAVRLEPTDA